MASITRPGEANQGPNSESRDLRFELESLKDRLIAAAKYLHLDEMREEIGSLEDEVGSVELWNDPERAREVTTRYGRVKSDIDELEGLFRVVEDALELLELANEEGQGAVDDVASAIAGSITELERALDEVELRSLFSGEHDERDVICEIHAGAGGTDAQDWAEMMLRMYLRWAERRGFSVEIDDVSQGQEAGILSATFLVRGRHAYGLLSAERGVHRLVRMSPFDSQHRRQTSFASFEVIPFFEDLSDEVAIDEKDLRIDTYRSSGAGGQHVNVTDSAVRITHLPTGIVVSCQNERSQHQNKARALQILAAKLVEAQRSQRKSELTELTGPQSDVAWGNQIRSYVLAPYQLVKDLRTDFETGNVDAVLDGDLDEFMIAFLRWRRTGQGL